MDELYTGKNYTVSRQSLLLFTSVITFGQNIHTLVKSKELNLTKDYVVFRLGYSLTGLNRVYRTNMMWSKANTLEFKFYFLFEFQF